MSGELTADEFYDVYRQFHPEADRDEFEREWATFQEAKAEHLAKQKVN